MFVPLSFDNAKIRIIFELAKFSANFFTAGQLDEPREPSKTIPLEFNYFHHEMLS